MYTGYVPDNMWMMPVGVPIAAETAQAIPELARLCRGDESRVTEGLQGLFSMGATEILASPVPAGGDREASRDRTLEVLSKVGQSLPE